MPRGKKSKQRKPKPPGAVIEVNESNTPAFEPVARASVRRSTRIRPSQADPSGPVSHPEARQALPQTGSAAVNKAKKQKQAAARPKKNKAVQPAKSASKPVASSIPAKSAGPGFDHSSAGSSPRLRETTKPVERVFLPVGAEEADTRAKSPSKPVFAADRASDAGGAQTPIDGCRSHSLPPPDSLTERALKELTKQLRSEEKEQQEEGAIAIFQKRYEPTLSEQRLSGIEDLDPVELFNRRWGYLPPLDKEAAKVLAFVLENPGLAYTMDRTGPEQSKMFTLGLERRGVQIKKSRSSDPFITDLQSLDVEDFLPEPEDEKVFNERLWTLDQLKCTSTSSEALFQRTLMVSLIARHFLIYQHDSSKDQILDFSVEELWTCLPMPTKALWISTPKEQGQRLLTQPKPDLALSFNRESLISNDIWEALPAATRSLACLENMTKGMSRIFHFLTIEAKSAEHSVDDEKALLQCLNNSSQALFNLYEFFRDAGPVHEKLFFQEVRVFSVVAMQRGFLMRCHRGVRLNDNVPIGQLVLPNKPTYRLRYVYEEVFRVPGSDEYNREKMLGLLKMVLKYAIEDLAKYIRNAAEALVKTVCVDIEALKEREDLNFYRYGQPSPEDFKKSAKASRSQTQASQATPRNLNMQKCAISSDHARSVVTIRSGLDTPAHRRQPRQTQQAQIESQESASQKRRREETHTFAIDDDDNTDELQAGEVIQPPRKNPRRGPPRQLRTRLGHQSSSNVSVPA